ncbi:DUF559 domain-containing protein [Microbacterium sp. HJ5]
MCTTPHPIATYRELAAAGLSRWMIASALARGSLGLVRRGVYDRGACDTVRRAAAHGGAIACVRAAEHLGLWTLDRSASAHVALPGHGRAYPHADCTCVVHWVAAPDAGTNSFGIPTVASVLRQILRCRGVEEFFVALESALRQRMLAPTDLAWLRAHTNDAARDAIAFARADADSGLESLLRWRLRPHGLRVRTQQHIVSVGRVDFLVGDRLIVEVDGIDNHDGPSHRHKDLVRDAHAAAWGYVSLRFDYAMVVHDWPTVELAILAHVDRGLHRF